MSDPFATDAELTIDDPREDDRLARFLASFLWLVVALIGVEAILVTLTPRWWNISMLGATVLGVPLVLMARHFQRARRPRLAVSVCCYGLCILDLAVGLIIPSMMPVLIVVLAWAVVIALPYLSDRQIERLVWVCTGVALADFVALVVRDEGALEPLPAFIVQVAAFSLVALQLIFQLLLQYRGRERERLETFEQSNARLRRANDELEAFSYSVSHDLRAPLRTIEGFSQALLEDVAPQLDTQSQAHLERIQRAAQRMGDLIDDLLSLARVARQPIEVAEFDLSELAQQVVSELAARGGAKPEVDIDQGLRARGDIRLVRLVLENLFANAFKFSSKVPVPRVTFRVSVRDGKLTYTVKDNGAGFDLRYATKLFTPFARLHRAEDFPGHGIGLANVKRAIEHHEGRVWAESEPGLGAAFHFTLNEPGDPITGARGIGWRKSKPRVQSGSKPAEAQAAAAAAGLPSPGAGPTSSPSNANATPTSSPSNIAATPSAGMGTPVATTTASTEGALGPDASRY